jgi:hypothetical protein
VSGRVALLRVPVGGNMRNSKILKINLSFSEDFIDNEFTLGTLEFIGLGSSEREEALECLKYHKSELKTAIKKLTSLHKRLEEK